MSMQEDIGHIKGSLEGIHISMGEIKEFIKDTGEHRQMCAANFAKADTQIMNMEEIIREAKEEARGAAKKVNTLKGAVTDNQKSIKCLKKEKKSRDVSKMTAIIAVIVGLIAAAATIIAAAI